MRDVILIVTILAMFVLGYYIAKRIDLFIDENQKMLKKEEIRQKQLIQIATENPILLGAVSKSMDYCSNHDSCIEFAICSGRTGRLLKHLEEGTVDLVLLSHDSVSGISTGFEHMELSYYQDSDTQSMGLPVQNLDEDTRVHVFWNKSVSSPLRDWVLLSLRRDECVSKCS